MTREEAIKRLKSDIYEYVDFTENPNENEFWMAFDMAIKALDQRWIPVSEKGRKRGIRMLKLMVMYFIGWFALYVGWRVFNCFYMLLEWLETRNERK